MNIKKLGENQTQLTFGLLEVLVSYNTPVAAYDHANHKAYKTEKYWSRTTSKHIGQWFDNNKDVKELPQAWFDNLIEGAH